MLQKPAVLKKLVRNMHVEFVETHKLEKVKDEKDAAAKVRVSMPSNTNLVPKSSKLWGICNVRN